MTKFGAHNVLNFAALLTIAFLFSGCESVLYGSLLTSAVTVNEIERHTLPVLEDIDRIEIQKEPVFPKADLLASNITSPKDTANLVNMVNNNRSSWKNSPLRVTPPVPNQHVSDQTVLVSVIFWKKEQKILKVNVNKRILTIPMGSGTIYREISEADAGEIARVIETSSYTTQSRPVHQYRLYPLSNESHLPR